MKDRMLLTDKERSCLVNRVLKEDLFYEYPTWFHNIKILTEEISEKYGMESWMLLQKDYNEREKFLTVADYVDNQIIKKDVVVEDVSRIIPENMSYLVQKEAKAEVITYNLIVEDLDMINQKETEQGNYSLGSLVAEVLEGEKIIDQDLSVKKDIVQLISNHPHIFDEDNDIRVKEKNYERVAEIHEFENLCKQDNQILDGVQGMRHMISGSLYGRIRPRLAYEISEFLDIRQVMMDYEVQILMVVDYQLKPKVMDMLVRNGYFIVDIRQRKQPVLETHNIRLDQYGVYSDIVTDFPFVVYKNSRFYREDTLIDIEDISLRREKQAVCVFTRSYMFDGIFDQNYGLLPSANPDRGQVICVYPPVCSYSKKEMLNRAVDFMNHRYMYLNGCEEWSMMDEFKEKCGYNCRFVIPKKRKNKDKSYEEYWRNRDLSYRKENPFNEDFMLDYFVKMLNKEIDKNSFLLSIIRQWGKDDRSWVRLWYYNSYELSYVFYKLEDRDKRLRDILIACRLIGDLKVLELGFPDEEYRRSRSRVRGRIQSVLL